MQKHVDEAKRATTQAKEDQGKLQHQVVLCQQRSADLEKQAAQLLDEAKSHDAAAQNLEAVTKQMEELQAKTIDADSFKQLQATKSIN